MTFGKKELCFVFATTVQALPADLGQGEHATKHLMGLRQLASYNEKGAAERAEKILSGELPPATEATNHHFRDASNDSNKILNALSLVERAAQLVSASQPVDLDEMSEHIQKISQSVSDLHTDSDSMDSDSIDSNSLPTDSISPAQVSLAEIDSAMPASAKPKKLDLSKKKQHQQPQVIDRDSQDEETNGISYNSVSSGVDASRVRSMQQMSEKMVEMVNLATQSDSMWKLWTSMANQTGLFGDFVHDTNALAPEDVDRLHLENDALVSKLMTLRQEEASASQKLQKASGDLKSVKSTMETEVQKLSLENQRYHELVEHLEGQSSQLAEGSQQLQQKKANLLQDIQAEKDFIEHIKTDLASIQQSNERLSTENQRMRSETEHFAEEMSTLQKKTAMVLKTFGLSF